MPDDPPFLYFFGLALCLIGTLVVFASINLMWAPGWEGGVLSQVTGLICLRAVHDREDSK